MDPQERIKVKGSVVSRWWIHVKKIYELVWPGIERTMPLPSGAIVATVIKLQHTPVLTIILSGSSGYHRPYPYVRYPSIHIHQHTINTYP